MNIELIKSNFKKYVETFDMNEKAIERKYYHSLRVMEIATDIARHNNFDEDDIEISTIVGLLHDYARFPQWTKYKTYNDINSEDHADWAVKLLFEKGDIKNFTLEVKYYDEIYDAIKNHNKYILPDYLSKHNIRISNVIRDADKLDIFYIFSTTKDLIPEDDEIISEDVKIDFYNNQNIDRRKVKNNSDNILLDLSMIYDLNFIYSYKYIKDNRLIEKIFDGIENKEKYREYFEYIIKFINKKVG